MGFLIAGVQKGGTSSLYHYLRQHRQIVMSSVKEPHFFDDEEQFVGEPDCRAYHALFRFQPRARIYGEATPIYLYWSNAMRRASHYNPSMKVIALLRNPIERAWSHWKMEVGRGSDHVPFSVAIREEAARCREALPLQHRVYSYVDRGFYSEQIARSRRFFAERNLLFIKSEDFFAAPEKTIETILAFLDVRPTVLDTSIIYNRSVRGDSSIADSDRRFLIEVFRKDVERVESMLGWNCRDWLS